VHRALQTTSFFEAGINEDLHKGLSLPPKRFRCAMTAQERYVVF